MYYMLRIQECRRWRGIQTIYPRGICSKHRVIVALRLIMLYSCSMKFTYAQHGQESHTGLSLSSLNYSFSGEE